MTAVPFSLVRTGLVSSVGLSAATTCAAIRAGVSNPTETRFIDSTGEWIMAQQVELEQPWHGVTKLAKMAAQAIEECLDGIARDLWQHIPLILCIAERERPGRTSGVDDALFIEISRELGATFAARSIVVPHGRAGIGTALSYASDLFASSGPSHVLVVGADTLLTGPTLGHYDSADRLLNPGNPNGFIPGEGAGALLLAMQCEKGRLICDGIGVGMETARVDLDLPLRADGLTQAIRSALGDAGCEMHELDFRIADLSGEQYYFKEAALALGRCLRMRKEQLDLWHPADCIGETGAAIGVALIAVAEAACRKGYAPGPRLLLHLASDAGQRVATVWHFEAHTHGQ